MKDQVDKMLEIIARVQSTALDNEDLVKFPDTLGKLTGHTKEEVLRGLVNADPMMLSTTTIVKLMRSKRRRRK